MSKGRQVATALRGFIAEQHFSQAYIARQINVSPAAISLFLQGKYKGDCEGLASKVSSFVNSIPGKQKRVTECVLAHLGEICRSFIDIEDDLLDSQVHPTSSCDVANANVFPMTPIRRARLEELREQKLLYIEKVIKDLYQIK